MISVWGSYIHDMQVYIHACICHVCMYVYVCECVCTNHRPAFWGVAHELYAGIHTCMHVSCLSCIFFSSYNLGQIIRQLLREFYPCIHTYIHTYIHNRYNTCMHVSYLSCIFFSSYNLGQIIRQLLRETFEDVEC